MPVVDKEHNLWNRWTVYCGVVFLLVRLIWASCLIKRSFEKCLLSYSSSKSFLRKQKKAGTEYQSGFLLGTSRKWQICCFHLSYSSELLSVKYWLIRSLDVGFHYPSFFSSRLFNKHCSSCTYYTKKSKPILPLDMLKKSIMWGKTFDCWVVMWENCGEGDTWEKRSSKKKKSLNI